MKIGIKQQIEVYFILGLLMKIASEVFSEDLFNNAISMYRDSKCRNFSLNVHKIVDDYKTRQAREIKEEYESAATAPSNDIPLLSPAVAAWLFLEFDELDYLFAGTKDGYIWLYENSTLIPLLSFPQTELLLELKGFRYENSLWLIGLHQKEQEEKFYVQLYEYNLEELESRQQILLHGRPSIAVAHSKNSLSLVVATSSPSSELKLFKWNGSQFRFANTLPLKGNLISMSAWISDGLINVAVSFHKRMLLQKILDYSDARKRMNILILELNCLIMKQFQIKEEHYLVCGFENRFILFWWNGMRLVEHRSMPSDTGKIVDIAVLAYPNSTLHITVAKKNSLEFYMQTKSVSLIRMDVIKLPVSKSIKSIKLCQKHQEFYLLPVFQDYAKPSIYPIDFDVYSSKIASFINIPILKKCTSDIKPRIQLMNEKLNEIQDNLKFAWTKTDYVNMPTVNINGSIFSKAKVDIDEIDFTNKTKIPELLSIVEFYKGINDKVLLLNSHMSKTVRREKAQTINGTINFLSSVRVMQSSIHKLKSHTVLNGVNTISFNSVMRKTGSQVFSSPVSLHGGLFTTVNTYSLNTVPITDYVTLNDSHIIVNGLLNFSHLLVQNMHLDRINDMNPATFFLSSGNQEVTERKTFDHLLCDIVSTKNFVNGFNITDYAKNVVRAGNMIFRDMIFNNKISILGRLTVKRIDGKDLSQLVSTTFKKNENEIINGMMIFYELVTVKKLSLIGFINNFDLNHIFTLKTDQVIPTTVISQKLFAKSIDTDSLNGIDISQAAVLRSSRCTVARKVHFFQSITAYEIFMESKGTLNAMKLSEAIQHIPQKSFMTFTDEFIFQNLVVENDISIRDARIEDVLFLLKNKVWLKKTFQNVTTGVFKSLSSKDLFIQMVNGIHLKDLVLANRESSINSKKIFLNSVHSSSLESTPTRNLINIDNTFVDENFSFVFKDMLVKGNMYVPSVNNLLISDLMQVKKPHICQGRNIFHKVLMKDLHTENISFSTFRSISMDNYFLSTMMSQKHILTAKFKNVKGAKLIVPNFLNGKDLDRFRDSVVTLDSYQNILAAISFSALLNLKAVKVSNLFDLNAVVLSDVSNVISYKDFIGNFSIDNMWLEGKINGISLNALSINAFQKNFHNVVTKKTIFQSNLSMPYLKVSNSSLDYVMFSELIHVRKPTKIDALKLSSVDLKNFNATGLVNKCGTFSELFSGALLEGKVQKVLSAKNFNSLSIIGNLHVKGDINGLSVDDMILTLLLLERENEMKNFIFMNVHSKYLKSLSLINGINLDFVVSDSVIKNKNQTIAGRKKFANLNGNYLYTSNVQSTFLCGVDIVLLESNYVSRTKRNQKLLLLKLSQMLVKNAVFEKRLNGLKIPEDLILTSHDDKIIFPVYIQNTTKISSDFVVFGSLKGMNLTQLVANRVSLSKSEKIHSKLKFLEDTTILGNMVIKGFANSLNFSNMVHLFGESVIHSKKVFRNSLVMPKITVLGSVNNKSMKAFSKLISKHFEAANFTKLVQFSNLSLSSLTTEEINALPLNNMWNSIHIVEEQVYSSLDGFSAIINKQNRELYSIEDGVNYHPSLFGFFTLHQLLSVGHAVKALPFYESGISGSASDVFSLQIVIWTIQNETCSYYKSTIMDIHPNGTLEKSEAVNGRLFPFTLGLFEENVKGLMFHSDKRIRCIGEDKENIIKTIYFNGDTHPNTITSPHNSEVLDAKFIELDIGVFLLVAYNMNRDGERLYLYEHEPFKDIWSIHQKFHAWNISSMDATYVDDINSNDIYLAVTGAGSESGIHLYVWDFEENTFGFKFDMPESIAGVVLWVSVDKNIYLLHAEEKTSVQKNNVWVDTYTESIKVYLLDELDDLIVDHTINIRGISSLEQFKLLEEVYVLAVSRHLEQVYVIQHHGFNGFEVIQEINAPGVASARIYITPNNDLFVIISSTTGHSRILKSAIRGGVE